MRRWEGRQTEGEPEVFSKSGGLGFLSEEGQLGERFVVVQMAREGVDDLVSVDVVVHVDVLAVVNGRCILHDGSGEGWAACYGLADEEGF